MYRMSGEKKTTKNKQENGNKNNKERKNENKQTVAFKVESRYKSQQISRIECGKRKTNFYKMYRE